jgi:hypothetical protein
VDYVLKLNYQGNYVKGSSHTKFIRLIIDDSLSWKAHIGHIMSKLSTAIFYVHGSVHRISIPIIQAIMFTGTLRIVYFAYVHSFISFGIVLWGNQPHSEKIFKLQKRVIRIITHAR